MAPSFADNLTRFVLEGAAVRGAVVSLDGAYRDILACHAYPAGLQRLLGETLAAVCLLANSLKFDGRLILQLHGAGILRLLVVECDASLCLRATAQWDGAVNEDALLADLAGTSGASRMALTLDPKDGGPLYQGVVALQGGSVAALVRTLPRQIGADREPAVAAGPRRARLRAAAAAHARRGRWGRRDLAPRRRRRRRRGRGVPRSRCARAAGNAVSGG